MVLIYWTGKSYANTRFSIGVAVDKMDEDQKVLKTLILLLVNHHTALKACYAVMK